MRFYKSMKYKSARLRKMHAAAHDLPKFDVDSRGTEVESQDVARVVVLLFRRNLSCRARREVAVDVAEM